MIIGFQKLDGKEYVLIAVPIAGITQIKKEYSSLKKHSHKFKTLYSTPKQNSG